MEFDVVVVGAGPAGLSTAIRLKQLSPGLNVVVLEKGSEVGAHILSGAVIDPRGLDGLVPAWRGDPALARTPVSEDTFLFLTRSGQVRLPGFIMPSLMSNHGNVILSLANLCRWLAAKAEALGVEIYPGFAAAELLQDVGGTVIGVATGDLGLDQAGRPTAEFQRGMALKGKYVVLAEGVRGSLSKQAIRAFDLAAGSGHQKYGLGVKELWRVAPEQFRPGFVQHTFGWPLENRTGGGSFLYHFGDGLVSVGLVVHLDYANPYLSPFEEFQRFKTHPAIAPALASGERLSYGARAISEGGLQAVPKLAFPGGVLVGDAAGFVNVPRIKGSHNAMLTGMLAADNIAHAIGAGRRGDELVEYDRAWRNGPVGADLRSVRNVKPLWSRFGTIGGIVGGGFDMWCQQLFGASPLGTLRHRKADHEALEPAARHRPIRYPTPDGVVSFDIPSSLFLSNTNHREGQPSHLKVGDPALQARSEYEIFSGPSARYCPAAVYEWTLENGAPRLLIHAQNCVHCKTCDIKDPNQNIDWVPPEGGGGPNYSAM